MMKLGVCIRYGVETNLDCVYAGKTFIDGSTEARRRKIWMATRAVLNRAFLDLIKNIDICKYFLQHREMIRCIISCSPLLWSTTFEITTYELLLSFIIFYRTKLVYIETGNSV